MHLNNRIRDLKCPTYNYIYSRVLGRTMISCALSESLIYNDWHLQFYWPRLSPPITGGDYSVLDEVE